MKMSTRYVIIDCLITVTTEQLATTQILSSGNHGDNRWILFLKAVKLPYDHHLVKKNPQVIEINQRAIPNPVTLPLIIFCVTITQHGSTLIDISVKDINFDNFNK